MSNRRVRGDDSSRWPSRLEDFTRVNFQGKLACASMAEATTIAQFAAIRIARGNAYAEELLNRLCANDLRVYQSNLETRQALAREDLAAALANSSNVHGFYMDGHPVYQAWLHQADARLSPHVESPTQST